MSSTTIQAWEVTKVQLYYSETHWRGRVEGTQARKRVTLDWDLRDSESGPWLGDRASEEEIALALTQIAFEAGVRFLPEAIDWKNQKGDGCECNGPFTPVYSQAVSQSCVGY